MKLNNKTDLATIRRELDETLKAFAAEHDGIQKFGLGNIRYEADGSFFTVTLSCYADGATTDPAEADLKRYAETFGFNVDKVFRINGKPAKLVGYKPRNRKYPFIYESEGRRYKTSRSILEYYIAKEK